MIQTTMTNIPLRNDMASAADKTHDKDTLVIPAQSTVIVLLYRVTRVEPNKSLQLLRASRA